MSDVRLSILIASLESRQHFLDELLSALRPQVTDAVQLLIHADRGQLPIGTKRQHLLNAAQGDYVCYIDDDDMVVPSYVASILGALTTAPAPDCVTFNVARFIDGERIGWEHRSILNNGDFETIRHNGEDYMPRRPNHLCPIRAELARQVGFKPINQGEDHDYAVRVFPLLKSEVRVDRELYQYRYRSRRPNEITNSMRGG